MVSGAWTADGAADDTDDHRPVQRTEGRLPTIGPVLNPLNVSNGSEAVNLAVSICFPNSIIKPTSSEAHSGLGSRRFCRGREWDRNTHNRVPFAVDGAES